MPVKQPEKKDSSRKKKNRDEPNWVMIHIYMEVPQANSLCSHLKQAKMSFLFSLFCKIRGQEGGTGPGWGVGTSRMEEEVGKGWEGEYSANTVNT
jgi:hypothetical protein